MGATDDLTARLLEETRAELTRADSKATTLFAVIGIATGAILSGVIGGRWDPTLLDCHREILWWIGCTLTALSLVNLGLAIFPDIGDKPDLKHARYYREIAAFDSTASLSEALAKEAGRQGDSSRDVQQLLVVSQIAERKFKRIRTALRLFPVGVLLGICAVLV